MSSWRANALLILGVVILIVGFVGASKITSKVKYVSSAAESSDKSFEECWSSANFTCIKSMMLDPLKDIWKKNEIRLMDSIVIEKIANVSDDNKTTKVKSRDEEGRGNDGDADQMLENVGRFLKTHALKVDLWNYATLRIERSQENPENLEIVFDANRGATDDIGQAKNTRMWKIIVPLIMGFKTTGALVFAISAVKLFLLKALVVSKLALLAAGFLVIKKFMSSMGANHHPYLYSHQSMPYFHDHGLDGGLSSGYGYSNYMGSGGLGGHYGASAGHGAHAYGASASGGLAAASAAEDLQAHYSNNVLTTLQAGASNQTATRKDGPQRRVFSLVKSNLNRVPVVTYRKLVDTGRSF